MLFNIYMDELLFTLERNGIGCYMGHHYFGAIGYADDLTLIYVQIEMAFRKC